MGVFSMNLVPIKKSTENDYNVIALLPQSHRKTEALSVWYTSK